MVSQMKKVTIIKYNAGNVMSVMYALERLNVAYELTNDPKQIENADYIIFPGVGEASTAMESLKETKLDTIIPNLQQPFLATCVGMQLLCKRSEEGDAKCLGIFDIDVIKFPKTEGFKIPQTGWNKLYDYKSRLLNEIQENAYVYFNHSYYAPICDFTVATTDYILPYSSILQKDNFYACQFHSEISSDVGEQIFKNFLQIND